MEMKKEIVAKNLSKYMDRKGLGPTALAKIIGVSQPTMSAYKNGRHSPDIDTLYKIAEVLEVSVYDLLSEEGKKEQELPGHDSNLVKIPILGTVRAGYNLLADENIIGFTYESRSVAGNGEYYSLIVEGESMINAGIRPGDRILVKKQNWINDGGIAVVLIDDQHYKCRLKIIFWEKNIRQGEFAKKVGMSPAGISALVNNKALPSFENVYKICKELDMKIEEIWEEQE